MEYNVYEAGKTDVSGTELHGGNFPNSTAGSEDFGHNAGGGTLQNGLSMKAGFMDTNPEEIGMGTVGPNELPIGPAQGSASRGHRFG